MDRISKERRSEVMSKIRSRDTKPEVLLRRALWARGLRYRVCYGPERIDIAFPSRKLAVFVDGCFWHGCPEHSHLPKSNEAYWLPKLKRNIERDRAKERRLRAEGWEVMRVWEHDVNHSASVIRKIMRCLNQFQSVKPI